jgi:hypothetical protein
MLVADPTPKALPIFENNDDVPVTGYVPFKLFVDAVEKKLMLSL